VALLATEALDLGDRDAGDADLAQRLAHVVEFERLDDRHHHLHLQAPRGGVGVAVAARR